MTSAQVLLYNIGTARVEAGRYDLIRAPGLREQRLTLVRSEIVDYQSRPYVSLNGISMPSDYELMQNYPNPFNPSTTIQFALPSASEWRLTIYNITGALVWEQDGRSEGGMVDVVWDGHARTGNRWRQASTCTGSMPTPIRIQER